MRITIAYDNTTTRDGLRADWGFACVIETGDDTVLFDTGASGALLLANLRALGIDPGVVRDVVLSHAHFDHVGGLSAFLEVNPEVTVHAPPSFRGVRLARRATYEEGEITVRPGVTASPMLAGSTGPERFLSVETRAGPVLVVGCAHPGLEAILGAAGCYGRPRALVGGLHGFSEFELLADLERICPTHCTKKRDELMSRFPDRSVEGGVGAVLEF